MNDDDDGDLKDWDTREGYVPHLECVPLPKLFKFCLFLLIYNS